MLKKMYQQVLAKKQDQTEAMKMLRPHSRAYKSIDLTANNDASVEEEANSRQAYQAKREEKAKSKAEFFRVKIGEGLNDSGRYQSAVVDQEMKKIKAESDIPKELLSAYYAMLKAGIKTRLCEDKDYKKLKGTGRFQNLD
jgi:hypothetical protein